jgi:hypothetical protein
MKLYKLINEESFEEVNINKIVTDEFIDEHMKDER